MIDIQWAFSLRPITFDVSSHNSLPMNHKLLLLYHCVVVVHEIFPSSGSVKVNIYIACAYMITVIVDN